MPTLYFDNFRGFDKTYLELKKVNFFVGENSTGKTSILKLIGILSSQDFWRYGEFRTDDINLGTYKDIITTPNSAKHYFDIGIADEGSDERAIPFYIKLRFIERDKQPLLKEINYTTKNISIESSLEGRYIKYRFKIRRKDFVFSFIDFKSWIDNTELSQISFNTLESHFSGIMPTINLLITEVSRSRSLNKSGKFGRTFRFQQPQFANNLAWIAPVRAKPQSYYRDEGRVYSPEGTHAPSVLRNILAPKVRKIFNRFGLDSGLFDDIMTRDLVDISQIEKLKVRRKNLKSEIFEIVVKINGQERNIANVGYGISQILPIIVEAIARPDNTWFAAQQPEVHLHPKAQAALGDFVFKTQVLDSQNFIIETHSDYLIDRFRLRLSRSFHEKKPYHDLSQIIFFSKKESGNSIDIIELNADGSYPQEQPRAFREFFIKEKLDLISI